MAKLILEIDFAAPCFAACDTDRARLSICADALENAADDMGWTQSATGIVRDENENPIGSWHVKSD